MAQTKHEQVIEYIRALPIDEKVSVRQLARILQVSEGTVYRAIKEAEAQGLVSSIPKVGTIRIQVKEERSLDSLSLHELLFVLDGRIVSGDENLEKTPKAYYVAHSLDGLQNVAFKPYTLIISTGEADIVDYAVEHDLGLLLVGGTSINDEALLQKAKERQLPIIETPYETFEAISAINQIIFERVKNRELVRIIDIMTSEPYTLNLYDTVSDWMELSQKTGHSRFPIVNHEGRLEGIISARDITNQSMATPLEGLMNPAPVTVHPKDLVAYLARLLVWESIELVPVVEGEDELVGVVSRRDVISALQSVQKQPQLGDTVDNLTMSGFSLTDDPDVFLEGELHDFMIDESDEISSGVLAMMATNSAVIAVRHHYDIVAMVKQVNLQRFNKAVLPGDLLKICVDLYPSTGSDFQGLIRFVVDDEVVALATLYVASIEE